ncbi:MAG: VOC family protein [Frankia sp.]
MSGGGLGFALRRLHHVQLAIPRGGEERARPFYVGALGLTEILKPPVLAARGGAWFVHGDLQVHLGVEDPFVPARKAHPALEVDGIDALAARLTAAGFPIRSDDDLPGHRHVYADDPFGNRLEFVEPVIAPPPV